MKRIEIDIADPKQEQRALQKWARRVDAGEKVAAAVPQLRFVTLHQLHATLTEKRLELLRFVADREGLNTRQIAQETGRDYKNVYDDVQRLCELGLLEKRDGKLFAPYDEIVTHYSLRIAA